MFHDELGAYWRAIAIRQRSSGVMRWSRSSALSSMSICTQCTVPVNSLSPVGVVVADAGAGVAADVGGLVTGEDHGDGGVEPTLADLVAVDVEGDGRAFGETAAVVGELHTHLVIAGSQHAVAFDDDSA